MKKRFCARIMYFGKEFHGYQIQPNAITVQETLEKALSTVYKEKIEVVGCGRTDTGVHALDYYLHFDTSFPKPEHKLYNINGLVGQHISIVEIKEVRPDFHARFDAVSRSYEYRIHTLKNPFLRDSSFFLALGKSELNAKLLHDAAQLIKDHTEFDTFCKAHSDVKTTICHITRSEWEITKGGILTYHISANRFLRGMVRLTVGALLNVAKGNLELDELKLSLKNRDKLRVNWSVPAHGLYLKEIIYPL